MDTSDIPLEALREHLQVLKGPLSMLGRPPFDDPGRNDLGIEIKLVEEQMDSAARGGASSSRSFYSGGGEINSYNVGMKRSRDLIDSEYYGDSYPETKSQKTTPSPIVPVALPMLIASSTDSPMTRPQDIASDEQLARSLHAEWNAGTNDAMGMEQHALPRINAASSSRIAEQHPLLMGYGPPEQNHGGNVVARQVPQPTADAGRDYVTDIDPLFHEMGYLETSSTGNPLDLYSQHRRDSQRNRRGPHEPGPVLAPMRNYGTHEVIEIFDSSEDEMPPPIQSQSIFSGVVPEPTNQHSTFGFSPYISLSDDTWRGVNGFDGALYAAPSQEELLDASHPLHISLDDDHDNNNPENRYGLIVDSQGNPLNGGWGVPGDREYCLEIKNYINHINNDPTKTLEQLRSLMENIRPDMEIPPEDREGTPDDMTYPLMEHQKLGLTWLKAMEDGSNKGGILADDMGLGKTIQALALIVSRKPPDPTRKTTLIVAPIALLKQWEREIEKKLKEQYRLKVIIHHGNHKKSKSFADLAEYDVVLTTFGTIGTEYKRKMQMADRDRDSNSEPSNARPVKFFFLGDECKWYRVIIDEAQCIKNKDTQSAKGCCALDAKYRLCLSGTPMQNSCDEMYSLLRFLRIEPYNEWSEFSKVFSRPFKSKSDEVVNNALLKLQALMKAVLLRRTKDSTIDGKPILTLPEKTIKMVYAELCPDEQEFYKALQDKSVIIFNKYLRANSVGKNYSNILVLLLRLRQACCHPHLIRDIEVAATKKPFDEAMIVLAKSLSPDAVARLKDPDAFECPICLDVADNPSIVIPCGHQFCSECVVRLHHQHVEANIASGNEEGGARCPGCRGAFRLDKVIDLRTFRKVHQPEAIGEPSGEEVQEEEDDLIYDTDSSDASDDGNDNGSDLEDFVVKDEEDEAEAQIKVEAEPEAEAGLEAEANEPRGSPEVKEEDADRAEEKPKAARKKDVKGKGKAKQKSRPRTLAEVRKDAMRNAKSKKQYMKYLQKRWISSAKVDKCIEILKSVREKDSTEKTIVFSQFTSLLDLVEIPIHQNGWSYRRYDGGMSATARNEALMEFTDDASVNIILVSLKAGNSGLNLVAASQVIILDPFYNPFIENQAIDRAHRIGQQRPVVVYRLIVAGTVEDRVLALQEEKRKLIEGALDETASKGIGRLNAKDLGFLFGI